MVALDMSAAWLACRRPRACRADSGVASKHGLWNGSTARWLCGVIWDVLYLLDLARPYAVGMTSEASDESSPGMMTGFGFRKIDDIKL